MKKVFFFVFAAAFVLGAALSCSKEEQRIDNGIKDVTPVLEGTSWTFTAVAEESVTKMGDMDGSGDFAWEDGDEIKILYAGGSTTASASVAAGKTSFSPTIPDGKTTIWLVYPSSMTASLEGENLVIGMPEAGKDALAGYFVAKASVGDEAVSFKHPVAYYKIVVDGDGTDVTRLTLTSAASNNLTATSLALSFDGSGVPSVASVTGGAATLTYDFSGAGTYYIPVVPEVSPAANDLTFQFYRTEDAAYVKAGAYRHSAPIDNERAHIKNWGSLPAKATNRYVSTTGSSSNNGATAGAPWDLATFKGFMENSSSRTADVLALYDGVNFHFAAGTYTLSAKIVPNINIRTNIIGHNTDDTFIDGSSDKLLFDIYKQTGETVTFKNITFKNGRNTNDGGAFRIGNGVRVFTIVFENCAFINNSITTAGKYGGALYICANSNVSFSNCTFGNGTQEGRNYAPRGGVLYATGNAKVDFTSCTFNCNEATASSGDGGGACIFANSANVIRINNSQFINNTAGSRGVIRMTDNVLVYMNAVSFNDNHTTENSSPWGLNVHGGNSFVCMNNVTSYGNSNAKNVSSDACAFNNDRGFIITNSTLIDNAGQYEVRINDIYTNSAYQKIHNLAMCNNIISNESAPNNTFWVRGSITLNNYGHNLRGSGAAQGNVLDSDPATDKYGQTHSVIGGTYSGGVYSWSGTLADFTPATAADVENAIKACTVEMAGKTSGTDFYAWLTEIGAIGKDARGVTRGTPWWPGAYQN